MKIFESASKIVFILMALAVTIGMFFGRIEAKDFMVLAAMSFSFYFSNKGETTGNTPYLGK
jgi:hypothetical protein